MDYLTIILLWKGILLAGLFQISLSLKDCTFQEIEDYSHLRLSNDESILYTNQGSQIIKCSFVCSELPECNTVILNTDYCVCRSQLTPHLTQIDNNTILYINTCSKPGYIFYNNMCINVSTEAKNWHEAKLDCENDGGTLIILDSLEKHQTVFNMLNLYYPIQDYFIGLSDISIEGTWDWIRENSSTYMRSRRNFDNNDFHYPSMDADCGILRVNNNKLLDEYCWQLKLFICEIII